MKEIVGVVLVILGVAYFSFRGITYTTQEKVLDIGSFEATATKEHQVPYSPLLAGAVVIGGIILLLPHTILSGRNS
jgi:hypothetical protein